MATKIKAVKQSVTIFGEVATVGSKKHKKLLAREAEYVARSLYASNYFKGIAQPIR